MANVTEHTNQHIERDDSSDSVNFGQYFRFEPTEETDLAKSFKVKEIYILKGMGVHHISNNVHNVTLFIPRHLRKSRYDESIRIHIEEFDRNFRPVPKHVAESERKQLLARFESEAIAIQQDIKQALTSPESIMRKVMSETNKDVVASRSKIDTSIPLLPSPEQMNADANSIVKTAGGKSVEILKRQLQNQQQLGEVVTVYARAKGSELSRVMENTASVFEEQAEAVKGQANSMLESVGDVDSKLEQLTLYMGDEVTVKCIVDKAESTSKEKVVLFSQMLYADEEMLTHNLFSDAKFDHSNLEQFFDYIRDNDAFRDRLMPTERCIVVIRARRTKRDYTDCPFTNAKLNWPNFETFMIIRDGQRINVVFSKIDYQTKMFPTQAEMDGFFSRIENAEDVKLTDAQKGLKKRHEMYSKVAAILQGIVDRQEQGGEVVFGTLPLHAFGSSFFDPQSVSANVRFINDEDFLVGQHKILLFPKNWLAVHFRKEHKIGDLIYFHQDLIDEDTAPSAFKFHPTFAYDPEQIWDPIEGDNEELKQVITYKGKPSLKIPTKGNYHARSSNGKKKNTMVRINSFTLNVGDLKPSELEIMIASRYARPFITANMEPLLQYREDIKNIKSKSVELRELVSMALPDLDDDEVYLTLISWISANSLDLDFIEANQPAVAKHVIARYKSSFDINDKVIESCLNHAEKAKEAPLFIAKDKKKTYLITDGSHTLIKDIPYFVANENLDNIYDDITAFSLYEINCGDFKNKGFVTNDFSSLTIEHCFVENDVSYQYKQHALSYKPDLVHRIAEFEKSSENFGRVVELTEETLAAIKTDDIKVKSHQIDKLIDLLTNDAVFDIERLKGDNVINPSLAAPACIVKQAMQYYPNRREHVICFISFDFLAAMARIAKSIDKACRFERDIEIKKVEMIWRGWLFAQPELTTREITSPNAVIYCGNKRTDEKFESHLTDSFRSKKESLIKSLESCALAHLTDDLLID